ncbi:MAG: pyrrolysine--tRNA(Pyl) ligase small subunit [Bacillota bacterium]
MGNKDNGQNKEKVTRKRYYRKRVDFFKLLLKMKLWPSRNRILHGIKSLEIKGDQAHIVTHCNEEFKAYNSKNSRAARFLRNKWNYKVCPTCRVPSWKLDKFKSTRFNQSYGSDLSEDNT